MQNHNLLINLFSSNSPLLKNIISELSEILSKNKFSLKKSFENWLVIFQEIGGLKNSKLNDDILELKRNFELKTDLDSLQTLFVFHTFYSIIIRYLTVKIIDCKLKINSFSVKYFEPVFIKDYFYLLGIKNFGESQYFDWYSFYKSEMLDKYFIELNSAVDDTNLNELTNIDFEECDLLKEIYNKIFSKKIRHHFGEFYTPIWLVDLSIEKSNYNFDKREKIIDPNCGSGTFLIRIIQNLKKNKSISAENILESVYGIDLNPLAVISSKANYIINLIEYLPLKEKFDIPIFHFDSVLIEKEDFKDQLYENNLELSNLLKQKFDFIIGNPPWINWKFLPEYYRNSVKPIAEKFNIFSHTGLNSRLGFAQDDLCVIITYSVIDYFLRDKGILSFILPSSLFKTVGGGEGFRQFKIGKDGIPLKVLQVSDLSNINAFDGAGGKASIFVCQKNSQTEYPIQYKILSKDKSQIKTITHYAQPISSINSSWITYNQDVYDLIKNIIGPSDYRARAGVCTWASAVYWIKILSESKNYYTVQNLNDTAKLKQKDTVCEIEKDFVFPFVRGREITRWNYEKNDHIILPYSHENFAKSIPENDLKDCFSLTYNYFKNFEKFLLGRKGYKKFLLNDPFYSVYDIGKYTISNYKVAWKYLTSDMKAVVLDSSNLCNAIIPDLNVITIATENLLEGHYIASLLNSSLIRLIIQTFGLCTRITPGVLKFLPIKKFEPKNEIHKNLAHLSIDAHKNHSNDESIKSIISKIDIEVLKMFGLENKVQNLIVENLEFYLKN